MKVSKGLRDRISTGAGQRHLTVEQYLRRLLDDEDRRARLSAVAEAFATTDPESLDDWRAETDRWSATEVDSDRPW